MLREALSSDGSVEGLDEGVVARLARPAEIQQDPVDPRPVIQGSRGELRPVVDRDDLRKSTLEPGARQEASDIVAAEAGPDLKSYTFPRTGVEQREHPQVTVDPRIKRSSNVTAKAPAPGPDSRTVPPPPYTLR